jgi:hypothetical protein
MHAAVNGPYGGRSGPRRRQGDNRVRDILGGDQSA